MKKNRTPHDLFFKSVMEQPAAARDFLELYMPPYLLAHCNMDTLKAESTGFIEGELRAYYADILWSVRTKDHNDRYIYSVIEHQSSADRLMPVRLMNYAMKAIFRHLKIHHKAKRAPIVIPVLFYAGQESPYPYSMNLFDAFDDPALARQLYSGDFPLVDITVVPDDKISQHRRVAVMEFLLKNIFRRDLVNLATTLGKLLADQIQSGYTNNTDLISALNYVAQAGDTVEHSAFFSGLIKQLPHYEGEIMNLAQRLRQEGWNEAWGEAWNEGHNKGVKEMALKLFHYGLPRETIVKLTALPEDELKKLFDDDSDTDRIAD